jgi:hypothetical protein
VNVLPILHFAVASKPFNCLAFAEEDLESVCTNASFENKFHKPLPMGSNQWCRSFERQLLCAEWSMVLAVCTTGFCFSIVLATAVQIIIHFIRVALKVVSYHYLLKTWFFKFIFAGFASKLVLPFWFLYSIFKLLLLFPAFSIVFSTHTAVTVDFNGFRW